MTSEIEEFAKFLNELPTIINEYNENIPPNRKICMDNIDYEFEKQLYKSFTYNEKLNAVRAVPNLFGWSGFCNELQIIVDKYNETSPSDQKVYIEYIIDEFQKPIYNHLTYCEKIRMVKSTSNLFAWFGFRYEL